MSESKPLFPAYQSAGTSTSETKPKDPVGPSLDWLQNASFQEGLGASQARQTTIEQSVDQASGQDKHSYHDESGDSESLSHYKKKKQKKHKRHRSPSPQPPEESKSIYAELSKKIFIEETGLAPEHAYRVDPKPDYENLNFSSLYKKDVARYVIRSRVLGELPDGYSLSEEPDPKKKAKLKDSRYFGKHSLHYLHEKEVIKIPVCEIKKQSECVHDASLNYLSINTEPSIRPDAEVNPLGVYDASTSRYLQGLGPTPDTKSDVQVSAHQAENDQEFYTRTLDFNKHLRENPTDISQWLKFVAFQDEIARSDLEKQDKNTKKGEPKSDLMLAHLERKLSILDRALKSNPRSVELAVTRLQVCQHLWEPEKVLSEWKNLAFIHPNSIFMWKHYLMYVQSHLTYFTVTKTIKLYTKCLQLLNKMLEGTFVSHQAPPNLEEGMLEIFFLYCSFLAQSGYIERAVASMQALAEFNLFTPHVLSMDMSLDEWKSFFEPFWDSGVPRFGEEGAEGWDSVMAQKKLLAPNVIGFEDLNPKEDDIISEELTREETWMKFEFLRENHHWLPWRPNVSNEETIDSCEDVDRMVPLDDVINILFRLKSKQNKFLLITYILEFFGLQSHNHLHSTCNKIYSCISTAIDDRLIKEIYLSVPFKGRDFKQNLYKLPEKDDLINMKSFVMQVLQQAIPLFSANYRSELVLLQMKNYARLDLHLQEMKYTKQEIKSAKKNLKDILKESENRNNLHFWREYGLFEWQIGNENESRKVFETAIFGSGSVNLNETHKHCSLFAIVRTYVELLLGVKVPEKPQKSDKLRTLVVLTYLGNGAENAQQFLNMTEDKPVPPTVLLKVTNNYKTLPLKVWKSFINFISTNGHDTCSSVYFNHIADVVTCAALFLYLVNGITIAIEIFEKILDEIGTCISDENLSKETKDRLSETKELIFDSYVSLMVLRTSEQIVPLSSLRKTLVKALEAFPSNPYFLRLFLNLEGQSYTSGPLRRFFSKLVQKSESPLIWMYAVYAEIEHHLAIIESLNSFENNPLFQGLISPAVPHETGLTWRIRSLFEKALASEASSHSVALWRMFVQFEVIQNNKNRAKNIFYRAIQKCPWSKVLYMDGIRCFPEDIQEIHDAMIEKELRIRTPLEEIDLLMENYRKSRHSDGEVMEDEAEVKDDDDDQETAGEDA